MKQKILSDTHKKRLADLGGFLREIRFSEGLTLNNLGNDLCLHKNTISRIEHGSNISLTSLFLLLDYYQIEIHEIFTDIK